eukprot:3268051-Rhodomonas_salina.1
MKGKGRRGGGGRELTRACACWRSSWTGWSSACCPLSASFAAPRNGSGPTPHVTCCHAQPRDVHTRVCARFKRTCAAESTDLPRP